MKKLSMLIAVMGMMISPMMQLQAQQDVQDIVIGNWVNIDTNDTIEIYKVKTKFFGKIIELKIPNDSIIVKNCEFNKKLNVWDKGSYYDYTDGTTFSNCVMGFRDVNKPDTLRIDADTLYTPANAPMHSKTTYWTKKKK